MFHCRFGGRSGKGQWKIFANWKANLNPTEQRKIDGRVGLKTLTLLRFKIGFGSSNRGLGKLIWGGSVSWKPKAIEPSWGNQWSMKLHSWE